MRCTITRLSRPVEISASLGMRAAGAAAWGDSCTFANMPGASLPSALSSTMRAGRVRLAASICGSSDSMWPVKRSPGSASTRAVTGAPAVRRAASPCGMAASSQSVSRLATRNSGVPAATVSPSRTSTSLTTPSCGARSASAPDPAPAPGRPRARRRWREASCSARAAGDWAASSARASAAALLHCGASISARRWPRRTAVNGARTSTCDTSPSTRAATTASRRRSQVSVPGALISPSSVPSFTSALRMPRFCCIDGSMRTCDCAAWSA